MPSPDSGILLESAEKAHGLTKSRLAGDAIND